MYKIKLSRTEIKELKRLKKEEGSKKLFRRLQCVQLRHEGKSNREIADITGACKDTVMDWIKLYISEGLPGLCRLKYDGRRQSKIDAHIDDIKRDLRANTIFTLSELRDWLKNKYSIEIEESWLFRCCKKNSINLTKRPV